MVSSRLFGRFFVTLFLFSALRKTLAVPITINTTLDKHIFRRDSNLDGETCGQPGSSGAKAVTSRFDEVEEMAKQASDDLVFIRDGKSTLLTEDSADGQRYRRVLMTYESVFGSVRDGQTSTHDRFNKVVASILAFLFFILTNA